MERNRIKDKDLIEGEIYFYSWGTYSDSKAILLYESYNKSGKLKFIRSSKYLSRGSMGLMEKFYEATEKEKRHLRACIAAGKYVKCPKEEIINSYQIF